MTSLSSSRMFLYVLKLSPIVAVSILGDYLLLVFTTAQKAFIFRALADSCCHGLVACSIWLAVTDYKINVKNALQVILAGFFGMLVDVDHFLVASDFSLKAALELTSRPPFHNTTLLFVIGLWYPLPKLIRFLDPWYYQLILIFFVSVLSHHLRDAHRRGLWFAPFGSTRPLPQAAYIVILIMLPVLAKCAQLYTRTLLERSREKTLLVRYIQGV